MGRLQDAQHLRQEVLDACRRNLGEEHPGTLDAEMWLALNLRNQGMDEAARLLLAHAYEVRKVTLGKSNQETVRAG